MRIKRLIVIIMVVFLFCIEVLPACSYANAKDGFSRDTVAINKAAKSVLKLEVLNSRGDTIATGSGFVAINNQCLITNYHVVEGAFSVIAISDDGEEFSPDYVLCSDKQKDIAILGFKDPVMLEPLKLHPDKHLMRGSEVIAIGSPIGIKNTVSSGIISAVYEEDGIPWIQITAPISHGSSGGAVFNNNGEVIGISSASYTRGQNLNLAINIGEAIAMFQGRDEVTYTFPSLPKTATFDYNGVYPTQEESLVASYDNYEWECPNCGNANNTAFCKKCGSARPLWMCACGNISLTPFCGNCGRSFESIDEIIEESAELCKNGEFEKAVDLLKSLKSFNSYSLQTCQGVNYVASEEAARVYGAWVEFLFEQGNYGEALEKLYGMEESETKNEIWKKAARNWAEDMLNYEEYYDAVISLLLQDTESEEEADLLNKAYYLKGIKGLAEKNYDSAIASFLLIEGYKDADQQLISALCGKIDELADQDEYEEAKKVLQQIKDEELRKEKNNYLNYKTGINAFNNGNYLRAINFLEKVKGYDDTKDILIKAYEKKMEENLKLKDYNRAKSWYDSIKKKNPEYIYPMVIQPGDATEEAVEMIVMASGCGFIRLNQNDQPIYAEEFKDGICKLEEYFGYTPDGIITYDEYLNLRLHFCPGYEGQLFSKMIEKIWDLGFISEQLPEEHTKYEDKYTSAVKKAEKTYGLKVDGFLTPDEQNVINKEMVENPSDVKGVRVKVSNGMATITWNPAKHAQKYSVTVWWGSANDFGMLFKEETFETKYSFPFNWNNNNYKKIEVNIRGVNYGGQESVDYDLVTINRP